VFRLPSFLQEKEKEEGRSLGPNFQERGAVKKEKKRRKSVSRARGKEKRVLPTRRWCEKKKRKEKNTPPPQKEKERAATGSRKEKRPC